MHIFSTRWFWLSRRQTVNIQNDNEKDEKVKTKHFKTTWFMPLDILILRLGLLVSSLLIVSIPLKVTISGRNVRTSGELWQLWSFTPLVYYNGQVHPLTVWNCACTAQTVEAGKVWRAGSSPYCLELCLYCANRGSGQSVKEVLLVNAGRRFCCEMHCSPWNVWVGVANEWY